MTEIENQWVNTHGEYKEDTHWLINEIMLVEDETPIGDIVVEQMMNG